MVLNSNTTRFGFTQFWLNCSNSRDCASDAFEYHNINKFILKVSKVSDTSSYMTYSHFRLNKLPHMNNLRIYYYDSKIYDSFLFKKLNPRTLNYLRKKFSKRNQKFDPKIYFKRSIYSIFLKNLMNNLKFRKLYFYNHFKRNELTRTRLITSGLQKLFLRRKIKNNKRSNISLIKALISKSIKHYKITTNKTSKIELIRSLFFRFNFSNLSVKNRKIKISLKNFRLNKLFGSFFSNNKRINIIRNLDYQSKIFTNKEDTKAFLITFISFLRARGIVKNSKFYTPEVAKQVKILISQILPVFKIANKSKEIQVNKSMLKSKIKVDRVLSKNVDIKFNDKRFGKRYFSVEINKWFPKAPYVKHELSIGQKKFKNEKRKIVNRSRRILVLKKYLVNKTPLKNFKNSIYNDKFSQISDNRNVVSDIAALSYLKSKNRKIKFSPNLRNFFAKFIKNMAKITSSRLKNYNFSKGARILTTNFYKKLLALVIKSDSNLSLNLFNMFQIRDDLLLKNSNYVLYDKILSKIFDKLTLNKKYKRKYKSSVLNFSNITLLSKNLKLIYPTNKYNLLASLVSNNFTNGLSVRNLFRFSFFINLKVLQNYVNAAVPLTGTFINSKFLEGSFYNFYKQNTVQLGNHNFELSTDISLMSNYFSSNTVEFRNFMSLKFFKTFNKTTHKFLSHTFKKDLPILLHSNVRKPVVFTPKLLGYQRLNPLLYSRFVARRLKQRFNLFETMKVLKNYLKSENAQGYLFKCSGRFTKKQRASIFKFRNGSVPISTFSVPVHYAYDLVRLRYGTCCIKVWISYKEQI